LAVFDRNEENMKKEPTNSNEAFEAALKHSIDTSDQAPGKHYSLRLFVSGMNNRSIRVIQNLEEICTQHLDGRYKLELIDILKHPEMAKHEQIIAIPTLIKNFTVPLRKFIGDLTEKERLLVGLDLVSSAEKNTDRADPF
jgi:circadian clock protein KaiB